MPNILKQLKSIAAVRSVGASTRIEGSKISDAEVEVLLEEIDITKLSDNRTRICNPRRNEGSGGMVFQARQ